MNVDVPLVLHLLVLGVLLFALVEREIASLSPADDRSAGLRRLDQAILPLLLVFALLAATRLADLL